MLGGSGSSAFLDSWKMAYGKLIDDLKIRVPLCRFIGIVDLLWEFMGIYWGLYTKLNS